MATIIKRETQPQFYASGKDVRNVAFDLADMSHQADAYLQDIHAKAAQIIEEAEEKAAAIRSQAEQAGRQAAEAAVERILDEKVAKQMKALTPALASAVRQIEDSQHDWLNYWEKSATQFACAIAARIIRREIKANPELPLAWIQEALIMCAGAAEVTIRLNPNEVETLGGQVRQILEIYQQVAQTNVVADPSITIGGCRVETTFGTIDQQIETQLARLQEELD